MAFKLFRRPDGSPVAIDVDKVLAFAPCNPGDAPNAQVTLVLAGNIKQSIDNSMEDVCRVFGISDIDLQRIKRDGSLFQK